MSGIAAIFNLGSKPPDIELLGRITSSLGHRGCDAVHHWHDRTTAIGHCMLHATPESFNEFQPLQDEYGRAVIAFDGRVDNGDELRSLLRSKGFVSKSTTDVELVLNSYLCWGESCVRRLIGDFAFAIWDKREARLFCARDPIGIKPLYYHFDGGTFLVCSEIHPIVKHASIPARPNVSLIARYMKGDFSERHETLYRGLLAIPPSHYLTIARDRNIQLRRYWDVDPGVRVRYKTTEEYSDHFLYLFREAIQCRLRTAGPVGCLLSGGLDSSSVVCTAQQLVSESRVSTEFETFSAVSRTLGVDEDGDAFDEREYIEEVLRAYHLTSTYCWYEEQPPYRDLIEAARCFPDILFTPTMSMLSSILELARQKHIAVMLSGVGGDELLGAASDIYLFRFADLIRRCKLTELAHDLRLAARYYPYSQVGTLIWDYGVKTLMCSLAASLCRLSAAMKHSGFASTVQERIYNEIALGEATGVSLHTLDHFCSQYSIEPRYPYFDVRLLEFVLAIPPEHLCRHYQTKLVLRRSMKGILPELIRRRRTKGTAAPVVDRELRDVQRYSIERVIDSPTLLDGIDWSSIRRSFKRYCQGRLQDSREVRTVERAVALELWHRSMM